MDGQFSNSSARQIKPDQRVLSKKQLGQQTIQFTPKRWPKFLALPEADTEGLIINAYWFAAGFWYVKHKDGGVAVYHQSDLIVI